MSPALGPPFSVLAQCPPGIERLLEGELAGLGARGERIPGGVQWRGGWRELLAAQLHLRTASRLLVEVARFRARALGELERKAGAVPWDDVLPPGGLRVRVSARRSRLNHRRAVEERIRRAAGREESRPPDPLLLVRIHRDEVVLRLDASGTHLHRRGYRTRVGEAPLRETLAAAALLQTGWDGSTPLFDPFCGSGTIPIEAALLSMGVPPGLAGADRRPRDAALFRWPGFPQAVQDDLVEEARSLIRTEPPAPIGGSDRDQSVLEAARGNARDAGVAQAVSFTEASASQAPLPPDPGWIVTNPPHGGRLGSRGSLRRLYEALGRSARDAWREWEMAVLVSDPVLAGALGKAFRSAFVTGSGGVRLECLIRSAGRPDPTGLRPSRRSPP